VWVQLDLQPTEVFEVSSGVAGLLVRLPLKRKGQANFAEPHVAERDVSARALRKTEVGGNARVQGGACVWSGWVSEFVGLCNAPPQCGLRALRWRMYLRHGEDIVRKG
jgi:hypothetical protein